MPAGVAAPSRGLGTALVIVLVMTAAGVAASVALRSPLVATATILWYGAAFAALAWFRPALAILALVVALPLITVEVPLPGGRGPTMSTDKLALVAVAGIWLVHGGWRSRRALGAVPAVRWWGALLGVVALSAVQNGLTVTQGWGAWKQALYALVFVTTLDVLARLRSESAPASPSAAAMLACGSAVVVALGAVIERALWRVDRWTPLYFKALPAAASDGGDALAFTGGSTRFGSTIGHVNFMAAYFVLILPIAVAVAVAGPRRLRWPAAAAAAVVGVGLLAARSAGAWGALAFAALAASVLLAVARLPARVVIGTAIAATAGLVLVVVLIVAALGARSPSFGVRQASHRVGVAAVAERPWLGFGEHGFARESVRLERIVFGAPLLRFHRHGESLAAHSAFVQVVVERGLLGLVAFAALLGTVAMAGVRAVMRPHPPAPTLGLVVGVFAFMVQAFSENLFDFSKVAALFWIAGALLVHQARTADAGL